ncbi:Uncharacterised protein [Burkholderia pseudomallei]|nr:Uncharacterised protein [Burkholderia pseudomallei]
MQHLHAVDRHVEHDDVVDRRAADRDAEAGEHGLAVMAQHVGERQRRGVAARRGRGRRRLVDRAPQPVAERREQRADDERHAPPPVLELRGAERRREQHAGERAGERGEPLARELERRIEAAPRLRRLLDQQRGGRADLAAGREPLQQARGHEQQRRRDADLRGSRRRRLVDRAPQPVAERREQRADDERHAPPPVLELRGAERRREQHAGERAGERGEPLARELERRIEAAPRLRRLLDQQRGGRADLAAGREPLQQARGHEQQRRRDADLRVSRRDGDRRGAERHDE